MMSVLFLVGEGLEEPAVIDQLLDTETLRERPNYEIAEGENLILSECGYEDLKWESFNFY
jgi:tRNA pseudouridine38/39 synthase